VVFFECSKACSAKLQKLSLLKPSAILYTPTKLCQAEQSGATMLLFPTIENSAKGIPIRYSKNVCSREWEGKEKHHWGRLVGLLRRYEILIRCNNIFAQKVGRGILSVTG